MRKKSDLEYLKLNKIQKILYKLGYFFTSIPRYLLAFFVMIGKFFVKLFKKVVAEFKFIGTTFIHGSWKTKVSYIIMGFGNISRGQVFKGLLFFLFEAVFVFYMIMKDIKSELL